MAGRIQKAAVLGSGVMGSGIAAHLANLGIPTLLLDIVPEKLSPEEERKGLTTLDRAFRDRLAREALKKLQKQKPAPLTLKENVDFIETGNLEDDLKRLEEVDWIIEAVVENLEVKKKVLADVDAHRKAGSIVSSNTSGISIEAMAEGRTSDFRRHFLGTHFFNPPRYLKLLEVIPTQDTAEDVVSFMKRFGEEVLGKGVVIAKDTPNFIANRIGTYGLLSTVHQMLDNGYSVGEVDSVTGPLIGRPKSATFRTLDVVGLDTFIHVANNVYHQVEGREKEAFAVPEFMKKMLEKGWIGSKAGQGFYLKKKDQGKSEILELNPKTLEYEARKKLKAPSIQAAGQAETTAEKLKTLAYANDRAGELLWNLLKETLLYTAEKTYEIADSIVAVDRAMKWGFGWEMGPFETWDALGLEKSCARMKEEGETIPSWIEEMLENGHSSFYKEKGSERFYYHQGNYEKIVEHRKTIRISRLKKENAVIRKNASASLIDIGDDVVLLEFHSKNNALGVDTMQLLHEALDEAEKNFRGLVIANEGKNFCVGANLALMLMEAQDENFDEIDWMARRFHETMARIRYSAIPVVSAPHQMALGGGVEVCMPTDAIQASLELYMGLVEVGVGLIPGAGGNKELYVRHLEQIPEGVDVDLTAVVTAVFETIATAKVSTSAEEARKLGFLRDRDGITVNDDHRIYDAKARVLQLAESGYRPPKKKRIPVAGEPGYAAMVLGAEAMKLSGYATDHDLKIAKKLAYVLAGGKLAQGTLVDEEYLYDLEREAFLSLIGEPKTQERMQHMLLKGKPLRN